jgi:hypothetical protein
MSDEITTPRSTTNSDSGNSPCDPNPEYRPNTTLMSRLAEALDGYRIGSEVCFVGRYWYGPHSDGHRLYGPFKKCEDAIAFREAKQLPKDKFGVFGPFHTSNEDGWKIGQKRRGIKEVVIHYKDGTVVALDGDKYDALFWSGAAAEKFALPYYMAIGSVQECVSMKERGQEADLLGHRIGSGTVMDAPVLDENGRWIPREDDLTVGFYAIDAEHSDEPLIGGRAAVRTTLLSGGLDPAR